MILMIGVDFRSKIIKVLLGASFLIGNSCYQTLSQTSLWPNKFTSLSMTSFTKLSLEDNGQSFSIKSRRMQPNYRVIVFLLSSCAS